MWKELKTAQLVILLMMKSNKDHRCGITSSFDVLVRWCHFCDTHTALLKRTSLLLGNYPSPVHTRRWKEYPRNKAVMCLQCCKFNFICDRLVVLLKQTSLLLGNYPSPAHTKRSLFWGLGWRNIQGTKLLCVCNAPCSIS